jgi:hypothetical protein
VATTSTSTGTTTAAAAAAVQQFITMMNDPEFHTQKLDLLASKRELRRARRAASAGSVVVKPEEENGDGDGDFTAVSIDCSDEDALYDLVLRRIEQAGTTTGGGGLLRECGFSHDQHGLHAFLAVAKARASELGSAGSSSSSSSSSGYTAGQIHAAVAGWWHGGASRFQLLPNFGSESGGAGGGVGAGERMLIVVFSSMGNGVIRPEFAGSVSEAIRGLVHGRGTAADPTAANINASAWQYQYDLMHVLVSCVV